MKDFELEMQLRETLHESADHMEADDAMKARIDLMLNNQNTGRGRKNMWKRLTVGVAAALCLTTVGAFARGQLAGLASSLSQMICSFRSSSCKRIPQRLRMDWGDSGSARGI